MVATGVQSRVNCGFRVDQIPRFIENQARRAPKIHLKSAGSPDGLSQDWNSSDLLDIGVRDKIGQKAFFATEITVWSERKILHRPIDYKSGGRY